MKRTKQLCDAYRFEGFRPRKTLRGWFGDPLARIITLQRRGKKRFVEDVGKFFGVFTTERRGWSGTSHVGIIGFTWKWKFGGWNVVVAA
jgi:hypothetical protein